MKISTPHGRCDSLCVRIGCQRFFLPVSSLIEEECQQRTHTPANQQRDPEHLISSVWKFRGSGEESKTVSQRHTDHNGGDHRDPHGGHGISPAPRMTPERDWVMAMAR